jgi:hypothetical protein
MIILKISVNTNPQKETEFLQALKTAFDKASHFNVVNSSFSRDVYENFQFHIELSWNKEIELQNYMSSDQYQYLVGALTVLGDITEQKIISADKIDKVN